MNKIKRKIILMSVGLLLSAFMFFLAVKEERIESVGSEKGQIISLRSEIKDISMDDILHANTNKRTSISSDIHQNLMGGDITTASSSTTQNGSVDDASAIERVQALIRQNEVGVVSSKNDIAQDRSNVAPKSVSEAHNNNSIANTNSVQHPKKTASNDTVIISKPEKKAIFNTVSYSENQSVTNAIKAFVYSDQTVMVGSTLRMRLGEDANTDTGIKIPRNTIVFGEITSINGERVDVKVSNINYMGNILPFKMKVFSKDALPGICVPGNEKADADKDMTAGALDGISMNSIPGIQAAQLAGVIASSAASAGKQVLSKNVRKVKVLIRTNYEIYLRPIKN